MAGLYYYKRLGKEFGPVPVESISELLASNQISPDDQVRCTSSPDWVQVKELPDDVLPPAPVMEFADIADMDDLVVSSESSPPPKADPVPTALDFAGMADMDEIELAPSSSTDVPTSKRPDPSEFASAADLDELNLDAPAAPAVEADDAAAASGSDIEARNNTLADLDIPDGPPDLDIPDGPPDLDLDDLDDGSSGDTPAIENEPVTANSAAPDTDLPAPAAPAKSAPPPVASSPVSPPPATSARAELLAQVLSETAEASPKKTKRKLDLSSGIDQRLLIVLGIGLVIVAWIYFPNWRSFDEQYAMLDSLSKEFQALRQRKASATEWDAFVKGAEPKIADLCGDLEEGDGGDDQTTSMIRRYLLFAAREYWPEMVATARTEPNKSEERFVFCMQTVKNLMEDLPPPPPPADEMGGPQKQGEG